MLKQIPGIFSQLMVVWVQATSMFTRGSESNHTAVLLNGRRIPTGASGQYDLRSI